MFVCDYANQEKNSTNTIPISITGDALVKKKIVKPDSTHVISYNCERRIAGGFDQVSFLSDVSYYLVDEKEEIIAVGCFLIFEEQRFDLY